MKVRVCRASGQPVDPDKAAAYQKEWQDGFDAAVEKYGKYGPETSKVLDELDKELQEKYNDLTIVEMELPKSGKAWKELLSDYGAIVVGTSLETDELVFIVNDMPM